MRAADRDVPVVVLSAVPPNPVRVREFRPFGVLHKPFPIDALLRLIVRPVAGHDRPAGPGRLHDGVPTDGNREKDRRDGAWVALGVGVLVLWRF